MFVKQLIENSLHLPQTPQTFRLQHLLLLHSEYGGSESVQINYKLSLSFSDLTKVTGTPGTKTAKHEPNVPKTESRSVTMTTPSCIWSVDICLIFLLCSLTKEWMIRDIPDGFRDIELL